MVLRVVERVLQARSVSRVIVATDDERILNAVNEAGYEALMTRSDHKSGTDRIVEVLSRTGVSDIIVNIQGDEPLISPAIIDEAVAKLRQRLEVQVLTVSEPMFSASEVLSEDNVKVVTDENGDALYFSRSPIPLPRDAIRRYGSLKAALESQPSLLTLFRKHAGMYVYRKPFLLEYSLWPQSTLELAESLEQLRILERGVKIHVIESDEPTIGVDSFEDVERVRRKLGANGSV